MSAQRASVADANRLHVWVDGCSFLPKTAQCCAKSTVYVRVEEIQPYSQRKKGDAVPLPATFIFRCLDFDQPGGSVRFHEGDFMEVRREAGWRLRFVLVEEHRLIRREIGFAEIATDDLARKEHWNLLLCQDTADEPPVCGEARPALEQNPFSRSTSSASAAGGVTPLASLTAPESRQAAQQRVEGLQPTFLRLRAAKAEGDSTPFRNSAPHAGPYVPGNGLQQRPLVNPEKPRTRVMMMTRGTRGDVQPFLALARGLILHHNCEVTIVTELSFKAYVQDHRTDLPPNTLHFRPSGGNTMKQTRSTVSLMAMRAGQYIDTLQAVFLAKSEQNFFCSEPCFHYWAWEEKPEFVVFGFTVTHIAMILSEALQIKIVGFFLQPAHELEQRITAETIRDQMLGPWRELIGGEGFNAGLQQIMELIPDGGPTLNRMRIRRGLSPCPRAVDDQFRQYAELHRQGVPQVVPINPIVLGRSADAMISNGMTPTDFIFLRRGKEPAEEDMDAEADAFIKKAKNDGRRVGFITFSSMPVGERKILMAAVAMCNNSFSRETDGGRKRPAIIAMVGGQEFDPVSADSVLSREKLRLEGEGRLLVLKRAIPFGPLFPLVDALVLHGGLGVSSEGLLAGKPIITSGILLMDQRYWAAKVADLGCGSPGVGIDTLLKQRGGNGEDAKKLNAVVFMEKALDQGGPAAAATSGCDSVTWKAKAEKIQKALTESYQQGDSKDGVQHNARVVFEMAMAETARPIRDAYGENRTCHRQCARQLCCCRRFWERCIHWLVCSQCPQFARIQIRCLRSCICCRWVGFLCKCCRYVLCCGCCRRRDPEQEHRMLDPHAVSQVSFAPPDIEEGILQAEDSPVEDA